MVNLIFDVVNPFDSSNPNGNTIGFMAICAGALVIFDFVILTVVTTTLRRNKRRAQARYAYYHQY